MPPPKTTAAEPISALYRLIFLYLEPFFAFSGAIQVLVAPLTCIAISHPALHAYLATNPADLPLFQSQFTTIAGGWLLLALNDIITLRAFRRQPRVWWYVMLVHLVSDAVYTFSLYQDGRLQGHGLGRFVDVRTWDSNEWVTNVLTFPFTAAKIAFLLGLGLDFQVEGKVKL
ncbi:uncharacterized protein AB675_1855 [Cyphellophora attinorum]|uniref:DUF7704 domain-containing protein n=1 Tax=Cyphellophora attinorum TaxID=1664694 RepID=A0A0N1H7Z6_9EURO|nr:uncharacterized protein AB675_1855 [Phialophora attinorum]KPI42864.1 hypothetical protein AB675_1855 [Phialophora attinorum]